MAETQPPSDFIGLLTEYFKRFGASIKNEDDPVDPKGHPIHTILWESNRYGPAIPVSALQQFAPGTPNENTLFKRDANTPPSQTIQYSAKVYEDVPQADLQILRYLAQEIAYVNNLVNQMIQLRGEKAYEIVSGTNDMGDSSEQGGDAIGDLRKNAMTRRDYAASANGWFLFVMGLVLAFWVFTGIYVVLNGAGDMRTNLAAAADMLALPAVFILLVGYGYFFIPGYSLFLPGPGPVQDQLQT